MFDHTARTAIIDTANRLDIPPAALLAVAEVESGGRIFARVGGRQEPLIRFEGHYFDRFLRGEDRKVARAAKLASPKAGRVKNPLSQTARWRMLDHAIAINRIAALSSVSWGLGQVMGAHWQWLGYGSVDALVAEARAGAAGQVALMARYIEKAGLTGALQKRDWAGFARRYNGPVYRRNRYDKKMAAAYARFSVELGENDGAASSKLPSAARNAKADILQFGSRGPRVRALQKALTTRGYLLVADGLFGLKTDRVLRRFQRDHDLTANGIAGRMESRLLGLPRARPRRKEGPVTVHALAGTLLRYFMRWFAGRKAAPARSR